jgi:isopentenyl-diphosphate delta-isomerase
VFRAVTLDAVEPAADEVEEFAWVDPSALAEAVTATPFAFSPWLVWQLEQWPTTT